MLRHAATVLAALWCVVQPAQSQDRVFANPPMLSSRDGRLDVDLVAGPGTYTIDGHQFQGMLYNGAYVPPVWHPAFNGACAGMTGHGALNIAYSITYAAGLNKSGLALAPKKVENVEIIWWAHKDSNLGPAD